MQKYVTALFFSIILFLQATVVLASDFETLPAMDIDLTATLEDSDSAWKNTVAYSAGTNENNNTIINRLSWRLQWEKYNDDLYWSIDSKLRLFSDNDLTNEKQSSLDSDLNLVSLYFQNSQTNYSVKTGYQTISLGYMDYLRISNILTPQDFTETVITSPEDSHLGQLIIDWSYYFKKGQLDLIFNLTPKTNHYPDTTLQQAYQQSFPASSINLTENAPEEFQNTELLIKWQQHINRHEYQLIYASLLQNDPTAHPQSLFPTIELKLEYPRYEFLASAYSFTAGNHQIKTELGFSNNLTPADSGNQTLDETVLGLAWEYNANGRYTFLVETLKKRRRLNSTITGFIPVSLIETDFEETAISWRKSYINETVNVVIYLGYSNPGNTKISSTSINYTPIDEWLIELVLTNIESNENTALLFEQQSLIRMSYFW